MSKNNTNKLTKFEEEVMAILWQGGAKDVHQVIAALPGDRKKSYTSVSTILRILEGKKFVSSTKLGRKHLYSACYDLEEHTQNTLQEIIQSLFSNQPAQLVSYLIDNSLLSKKDIQDIESLIQKKGAA